MRIKPLKLVGLGLAVALVGAACGRQEREPKAVETSPTAAQQAKTPPLIGGFAHGKAVTYILTDISSQEDAKALSKATGYPVAFVARLGDVPDGSLAKLYLFMNGIKGPNPFGFQPNVLDSIPGDPGYSPLWRVYSVTWKAGATPRELRSEEEILQAEKAGELTFEKTPLVKNSPVATTTPPLIGGFVRGRAVNYLLTDISSEDDAKGLSKATGFSVTFVPSLGRVPEGSLAKLYLFMNGIKGPNPFGFQPNVLDSIPGDPGYSPLWRVYSVTWKAGATPRELKSEEEILQAEKAGELTFEKTPLVKNSPVVPS